MSDGWLTSSKYERIPITGCTGPGTMTTGYAWKSVFHTTESPPGSIEGVISLFKSKPCSCPHFTIDPFGTGRRVQHIPWTWSACALVGGAAGYQTNRGAAVQMEICQYARSSRDWSDDAYWQIADVIADLIKDGCHIDPDVYPDYPAMQGILATPGSPQRLSWDRWKMFPGLAAHVIVPNNDHWDWGFGDGAKVSAMVHEILDNAGIVMPPARPGGNFPPAPQNPGDGLIMEGMTGGQVQFVQDLLVGLGYDLGPAGGDGVFGPDTKTAVMAFQRDKGLAVDGIVGPATNAAISAAYGSVSGKPSLPPPTSAAPQWSGRYLVVQNPMLNGGDVQVWQSQMHHRGWPISIDGWYGHESAKHCFSFQREKGLTQDGVVGPQTWNAAWGAPVT